MMTTQVDRLHPLNGNNVDDQGNISGDFWGIDDCLKLTPPNVPTQEQNDAGNKFFAVLSSLANRPVSRLWGDASKEHLSLSSANQVATLMAALSQAGGVNKADASALANYTGGGVYHKGVFGVSDKAATAGDYLSPMDLVDAADKQTNVGQALLRLKKANPIAHNYVVYLAGAKAAKKKAQQEFVLAKDTQKVINTEIQLAKKAAQGAAEATGKIVGAAADVTTGLADTVATGAKVISYLPWILGGGLILAGYLAYRNRGTIVRVASKGLIG
jgi:hypothetical protein